MVNLLFFIPLVVGVFIFCLGLRKSNTSKVELPALLLLVVAWLGPLLITEYLSRGGAPVEFVVPNGFRGTIEVIKDQELGEDLCFEHGTCRIVVPASGVTRLKETYPFHRWHNEWCYDTDGNRKQLNGKGATSNNEYFWEVQ